MIFHIIFIFERMSHQTTILANNLKQVIRIIIALASFRKLIDIHGHASCTQYNLDLKGFMTETLYIPN